MQYLSFRTHTASAGLKRFHTAALLTLLLGAAITVLVSGPGGRLLTPVKAATLTVCPVGCSSTTINGAIALANVGDTIQVAAGTYNEQVAVNKNDLILLGANAGINPCTGTRGSESIVSNPNGAFQIVSNNVHINGFQVQGVTGGLGAGIYAVGVNDTDISHNIIQNNIIGVALGGVSNLVLGNLIRNNNNPGASSGTGVYSDAGLTNSSVVSNCFSGHTRAAVNLIGAPVVPGTVSGVNLVSNTATNDAAFSFIGGTNYYLQSNRSSGASTDAIRFRGGVNGAEVLLNDLANGAANGISVRNDFGGPNTNIKITCSRLVGFAAAALSVGAGAHTGTLNAEDNFFGCNAGPNNVGCGTLSAPDNNVDFTPWKVLTLTASINPVLTGQPTTLTARFDKSEPGGSSNCIILPGLPITMASTCGTLNPAIPTISGLGAQTALTAGAPGACSSSATLDNQTVTLNQTVVPAPTLTIAAPAGCIGPGTALPVTIRITNSGATAQAIDASVLHPPNVTWLPSSCTANVPGNCQFLSEMFFIFQGTIPAGQTAVISYLAQVGEIAPNTQLCLTPRARFNAQDALSPVTPTCVTVNCPPPGPGAFFPSSAEVSGQKGGSVLVYNLFSSSAAAPNTQNTRISLTNTHVTQPVAVHLFFVDSSSCSVADAFICLTQNQTVSFLAGDLDPGTTGYIIAVASSLTTGCPINFNYLAGDEFVKLASGHAANLAAESIAALPGGLPVCNDNSVTAQLNFDGASYNRLPRVLADSNIPSRADGNDTLLVINRIGGNLSTGAATIGTLFGILYDDAESPYSFGLTGGCQIRGSFGAGGFPRTTPPVSTILPAGRSGWLKVYHQTDDIALLGAAINFNASAGNRANAFNQGHNLHKLRLSAAATLTIPTFPPRC